jgi:hypothetical protein
MCWGIKLSTTVSFIIPTKPTHRIVPFIDRKASAPMDTSEIFGGICSLSELFGVVSYLHILAIFAVDKQYIKQQSAISYIYIYFILFF